MSTSSTPPVAPIAVGADEGEALWFLQFLVTIKASSAATDARVAEIAHGGPRGADSSLHIHSREDQGFYVSEREVTFTVSGEGPAASEGSSAPPPEVVSRSINRQHQQPSISLAGGAPRTGKNRAQPSPTGTVARLG